VLLRPSLGTPNLRQVIRRADLLQQPQHTAGPRPRHVIEPRWPHLQKPTDAARLPGNRAIAAMIGRRGECDPAVRFQSFSELKSTSGVASLLAESQRVLMAGGHARATSRARRPLLLPHPRHLVLAKGKQSLVLLVAT
jgi:hypothetical protein